MSTANTLSKQGRSNQLYRLRRYQEYLQALNVIDDFDRDFADAMIDGI